MLAENHKHIHTTTHTYIQRQTYKHTLPYGHTYIHACRLKHIARSEAVAHIYTDTQLHAYIPFRGGAEDRGQMPGTYIHARSVIHTQKHAGIPTYSQTASHTYVHTYIRTPCYLYR